MFETLVPWVLFSLSVLGGGVLWLRRHRRVGRGRHSEFDAMKSVAMFAEVASTVYARQDAATKERLAALRVSVPAKLSTLVAQFPGVTVPVEDVPGQQGRHALVVDHRPPAAPVPPAADRMSAA